MINNKETIMRKFILDKKIRKIKTSADGTVIYGLSENKVLKFKYEVKMSIRK